MKKQTVLTILLACMIVCSILLILLGVIICNCKAVTMGLIGLSIVAFIGFNEMWKNVIKPIKTNNKG